MDEVTVLPPLIIYYLLLKPDYIIQWPVGNLQAEQSRAFYRANFDNIRSYLAKKPWHTQTEASAEARNAYAKGCLVPADICFWPKKTNYQIQISPPTLYQMPSGRGMKPVSNL